MESTDTAKCPMCGHETHLGIKESNEVIRCLCGATIAPTANPHFTSTPVPAVAHESVQRFDQEPRPIEELDIKAPPTDPWQGFCLIFAALSLVTTCGPPAGFVFGYRTYREAERLLTSMQDGSINPNFERTFRICWWIGIVAMTVNSILVSILVIWITARYLGLN